MSVLPACICLCTVCVPWCLRRPEEGGVYGKVWGSEIKLGKDRQMHRGQCIPKRFGTRAGRLKAGTRIQVAFQKVYFGEHRVVRYKITRMVGQL